MCMYIHIYIYIYTYICIHSQAPASGQDALRHGARPAHQRLDQGDERDVHAADVDLSL